MSLPLVCLPHRLSPASPKKHVRVRGFVSTSHEWVVSVENDTKKGTLKNRAQHWVLLHFEADITLTRKRCTPKEGSLYFSHRSQWII